MKRKKISKISTIIFIFLIVTFMLCSSCYATIDTNNVNINTSNAGDLKTLFEGILGFVQIIGSAASVIIIVVIGIKYMLSSVDEKAEYKKTATYYIIGAILIFSTSNVVSILYNVFN